LSATSPDDEPSDQTLEKLADLLNKAQSVRCSAAAFARARMAVDATRRSLKAPIVHALRGKEHVEWENPYDVGMTGLIGFASGYQAMEACDALLILGADFPYRQFYPKNARIAQIEHPGRGDRSSGLLSSLAWSARLAPPCVHCCRALSPNAIEAIWMPH